MTSLVLGVVGGVIGAIVGGPVGAQIGFLAGSLIGSLIDPPKVQGPRLGDLRLQRSTYGIMLPWVWGTGRLAGNVIDQTDLEEHEHKAGGKGGPEVTNFTYTASFAIALCQTPVFDRDAIIGVLRLWADGRLIWDSDTNEGDIPCTVYVGSEEQEPDPTFEAIHGVGNQPAYRGIAYLVFTDYDLTDFGNRIPQIEAEVYTKEGGDIPFRLATFRALDFGVTTTDHAATRRSGTITTTAIVVTGSFWRQQWDLDGNAIGLPTETSMPSSALWRSVGNLGVLNNASLEWYQPSPLDPTTLIAGIATLSAYPQTTDGNPSIYIDPWIYSVAGFGTLSNTAINRYDAPGGVPGNYSGVFATLDQHYSDSEIALGSSDDGHVYVMTANSSNKLWKFDADLNLVHFWNTAALAGTLLASIADCRNFFVHENVVCFKTVSGGISVVALVAIDPDTYAVTDIGSPLASHNSISHNCTVSLGGCLGLDEDGIFSVCLRPAPVLLSEIVGDLTENTPLAAGDALSSIEYDVTELTDEVRWYVIASQMTVRNAIQGLRPIFFFDAVESDDIVKFRKRGLTGSIATIPDNDLCARPYGEEAGDPLLTVRKREQELPRTVTLTYIDVDTDYQTGAQNSPRQTTLSEQDVTIEVAVGLTADEALQKCLAVHTAEWVERESFQWSTTRKWAYLEPCDVVTVRGRVIRIRQRTESPDGTIKWEGVLDAPSLYEQDAPGAPSEGFVPQEPAGDAVDTQLILLDIPLLSLNDAPYGFYAAAGPIEDGRWAGYGLYKSLDGGTSYNLIASSNVASVIGRTVDYAGTPAVSGTLPSYGGGDVVEEVSLCVVLTDADAELVSVTSTALNNGANLCAISRGTTSAGSPACDVTLWELLQFRDAVLVAANTYILTGFLRGRKGTLTTDHAEFDTFVLLPVLNVDAPAEEIGVCLDYKAVTFGQAIADVTAQDFINTGKGADSFFDDVGSEIPPFTGDTGSPSVPAPGQVPAPEVGDCADGKFLSACGTWETPLFAPVNATYVVMSSNATLTNERTLSAGSNVTINDSGTVVTIAAGITGGGDAGPGSVRIMYLLFGVL